MISVGIGCRKACPAEDIVALVTEALALLPEGIAADALFTLAEKRGDAGVEGAAAALGLPLNYLERDALAAVADRVQTRSRCSEEAFGIPSVAEAAALAGAGEDAVLLVPRRTSRTATCAIAGPVLHASSTVETTGVTIIHDPARLLFPLAGEGDLRISGSRMRGDTGRGKPSSLPPSSNLSHPTLADARAAFSRKREKERAGPSNQRSTIYAGPSATRRRMREAPA